MPLTITLVEQQPHRQRYLVTNVAGAPDVGVLTQAQVAAAVGSVAGQPLFDFMSQVFANLGAWTAEAFEGPRLRATIAPTAQGVTWGVAAAFAAALGNFTISASANGTAYLDITFEYFGKDWPPSGA